jgi:hypothetical protein
MATPEVSPDAITPASDAVQYAAADWASDIDLTLLNGGNAVRGIQVDDAGSGTKLLIVETVRSRRLGETRTFTVTSGWTPPGPVQITKIKSTSTVARVTVLV